MLARNLGNEIKVIIYKSIKYINLFIKNTNLHKREVCHDGLEDQVCWSPQIDLHIEQKPDKNSSGICKKQQAGPKVSVEMRSTNSENDLKMQEKGWKSKQLGLRLTTELVWSGQGGISLIDKEANGTDQGPERDHIW